MSLAKRIANRINENRSSVDVDEWGEDGIALSVHFSPMLAGEMDRLQKKHKNFLSDVTFSGMVDLIIMKAEGKDGEKLFTLEDKPVLMREDISVISKVAGAILTVRSSEDFEKN